VGALVDVDDIISVSEAAAMLKVSRQRVDELCREGRLTVIKEFNKFRLLDRRQVLDFMVQRGR
jgi:excisionase family DNA binding protein